jgi:hypothetical protein
MVISAGGASGIAATARLMAVMNISSRASPRNRTVMNTTPAINKIAIASRLLKRSRRFCKRV